MTPLIRSWPGLPRFLNVWYMKMMLGRSSAVSLSVIKSTFARSNSILLQPLILIRDVTSHSVLIDVPAQATSLVDISSLNSNWQRLCRLSKAEMLEKTRKRGKCTSLKRSSKVIDHKGNSSKTIIQLVALRGIRRQRHIPDMRVQTLDKSMLLL